MVKKQRRDSIRVAANPTRGRSRFLVFGAPHITDAEIAEVVATMKGGWLGTGPRVARFEEEFRTYAHAPHAVAVNSCTAALHLSLLAADLGPNAEVIVPALTFCATVNAVIHAGCTPVLADVDPATQNIDPASIERAITPRTRAIVPVHFAGRPCDMRTIMDIAARHGLKIIEDCAHAIESQVNGQHAGTIGDFGCFSFYVTKNVTTGEGGMVLTRNEKDAARIKTLALHGMTKDAWKRFGDEGFKHYQVVECGFKYNMMDLQAAIGIHQLARVESSWRRREEIWRRYNEAFADLPIGLPAPVETQTRHGYHLYTIMIDETKCGVARDTFLDRMTRLNIGIGVHYLSIPEHPYYQQAFGWRPEQFPCAMRIGRATVSLPLSPGMTDGDVEEVIAAVQASLS